MATLRMTLTLPAVPFIGGSGLTERIRQRFAIEAGQIIILAIRNHLGTDSVYTLEPSYAAVKPRLKKFRRFPGKPQDQSLILSGEMFNALVWTPTSTGVSVQVEDGRAESDHGFDYAEFWEEITDYLEIGLSDVEDDLPEMLAQIIQEEMIL